jgi:beta-galactosidase
VGPDRVPHPGLFEAKAVWQPVRVTLDKGRLRITNEREFAFLDDLTCTYELLVDGVVVESGPFELPVLPPGKSASVKVPGRRGAFAGAGEAHCTLRFCLALPTLWADAGHEVAACQVELPVPADSSRQRNGQHDLSLSMNVAEASGPDMPAGFGLQIWRPFIDNDGVPDGSLGIPGIRSTWTRWGLPEMEREIVQVRRMKHGVVETEERLRPARGETWIIHRMTMTPPNPDAGLFDADDETGITFRHVVDVPPEYVDLARLGVSFPLDAAHTRVRWFGRGPHDSYVDRRSSALVGLWDQQVENQFVPYLRPQDSGHHVDTRWFEVVRENRLGVRIEAGDAGFVSFAVLPYSDAAIEAATIPSELEPDGNVWVHIDHLRRGVGTGSCGPDTLPQYRIGPGRYEWTWTMGPASV